MPHLDIQGGEQYLGFAHSLLAQLRLTGLQFVGKRHVLVDATVEVRIDAGHEFIRIRGSGGAVWVMLKYFTGSNFVSSGGHQTSDQIHEAVILKFSSLFGSTLAKPKVMYEASVAKTITTGAGTDMAFGGGQTTSFDVMYDPGDKVVPHQFGVAKGKAALHYALAVVGTIANNYRTTDIQETMAYGESSHSWLYNDLGEPTTAPTFFKDDEVEYSLGYDYTSFVPYTSWKMKKTGNEVAAAEGIIWTPFSTDPPIAALATRTTADPKYTRHEGRWNNQGIDFLQLTDTGIADRRMDNGKDFDTGTTFPTSPLAIVLNRDKFIRFKGGVNTHGDYGTLQLCRQIDGAATATVIKEVDLRTFAAVSSRTRLTAILDSIITNGAIGTVGYGQDRNRWVGSTSVSAGVSGTVEVSVMPDMADRFNRVPWFENAPV